MAQVHRVCLIGPESTGKSTLAERLAKHFGAPWVREFSREYAESRNNRLSYADVESIAQGQMETEARGPRPEALVILDTDLISTVVYARHYYGRCPQWIIGEARARRADLYLLMDTGVPWIPDPVRDAGGAARQELFDAFRAALDEFETRWTLVGGDWDERFRAAAAGIATLIA
ncbi:MAG: AAA family ATPase [Thermoanaerobaculia bacterium]